MRLYNTLTRKKEEFEPLEKNKIKIYSCGPTVYSYIHIGNARPMVVFDTLRRYLEYKGYDVIYVQNFTDVDDKIINRAIEENVDSTEISERYIKEALIDEKGLNIKEPTYTPKVTDEMPNIIKMIETLEQKGYAYEKEGTVYFNTKKFNEYGKLSKKNIEELEAGSRVEVDSEKINKSDFVLWKPAKPNEPKWKSPWGEGRPGWHIECSAMIKRYLGDTIDIHTGGEDLVFPHHENEISQSEAVTGKPLARFWLHNGFINIDNQKMSKSAGNFFTIREISEKFPYEVIRFFIINAHYRMPINFSDELLQAAENSLNRIKNCVVNLKYIIDTSENMEITPEEKTIFEETKKFKTNFENSLEEDLNTADAVTAIFDYVKFVNKNVTNDSSIRFAQACLDGLTTLCSILGLDIYKNKYDGNKLHIEKLIEERQNARKNKDFQTADNIRNQLNEMGIILEDTPNGVRWSYKGK